MHIDEGRLIVRWQDQPDDLPQLATLFNTAFPKREWTAAHFARFSLRRRKNNVIKLLVGHPKDANAGKVYAAVLYSVGPDAVRVRYVVVHPDYRRKGMGRYLMSFLTGERSGIRRRRFLAKFPDALQAQVFFRALGFRAVAVRPGKFRFQLLKRTAVAV